MHHLFDIADFLADHDNAVGRDVLGELHTIAVKNLAACRGDQADVDPVFFGQQQVLIGLIDLKIVHAGSKAAHEQQLHAAQQRGTAAQLGLAGV